MATSTTRVGLVRPEAGDTQLARVDFANNMDKIDTAIGQQVVTSSTRPSSTYSGKPIWETDRTASVVHDGTAWRYISVPVASSLSSVTATHEGQLGMQTSDGVLKRWTGSAWEAPHTISQHGLWIASGVQAVANNTNVTFNFDGTTPSVTTLVSKSTVASGSHFTFAKAGVYMIEAQVVWASNTTGYREMAISGIGAFNQRYGFQSTGASTNSFGVCQVNTTRWFDAGAAFRVTGYQNSGGSLNMTPDSSSGIRPYVSVTFLGVGV